MVSPRDPSVSVQEAPRLSRQCLKMLGLLRVGECTNRELAGIALKYTGRISDLRAAGYVIELVSHDRRTGETSYRLGGDR